jgi:hypothetical protein
MTTAEREATYDKLHETIEWARMPRPQADGYDSLQIAQLAHAMYGVLPRAEYEFDFNGPSMFGRRVPLVHLPHAPSATLQNAPLDHPNIARGERVLQLWPEMYEQCGVLLTSIRPLINDARMLDAPDGDHGAGCSCGNTDRFGGIESTVHGGLGFAEGIVHELGHWKLHAMGVHLEDWSHLVANSPSELFESPIRKDKARPMGACIQAQYSYLHVLELNIIAQSNGIVAGMLQLNRDRMRAGRETLRQWTPTPGAGEQFAAAMDAWTIELLDRADALLPQ